MRNTNEPIIAIFVMLFAIIFIVNIVYTVKAYRIARDKGFSFLTLFTLGRVFSGIDLYILVTDENVFTPGRGSDVQKCRADIRNKKYRSIAERTQPTQPRQYGPRQTTWVCPHCGTVNSSSQMTCKDCGSYK